MIKKLGTQILVLFLFLLIQRVYSEELKSSTQWRQEELSWLSKHPPSPEGSQRINYFIKGFQKRGKQSFIYAMEDWAKYLPLMKEIFQKSEIPEELVYLAMIESEFNPNASYKANSGMWQFTPATAKRYGLRINDWIDERKDIEKSTMAAARYLKELYNKFDCWCLALAGYNAGEEYIRKAIKRYQTRDFWKFKSDGYLKKSTLDIVPKSIAAALIAKHPERFGFDFPENHAYPFYEKMKVAPGTDLREIAQVAEIELRELKALNPELKRLCTPPDYANYELKVPLGKRRIIEGYLKDKENSI